MLQLSVPLILGSASPRRKEILSQAGLKFEILVKEIEEIYPSDIPIKEVPVFLAELKANAFEIESRNNIVLTSDTVVILNNKILGKPKNDKEAVEMLKEISGNMHEVVTGVCIKNLNTTLSFSDITKVYFNEFTHSEIDYYVQNYKPLDKAGAYGIQEWIGMIGINKIEGSFYNVMGLPIHLIYRELNNLSQLIAR